MTQIITSWRGGQRKTYCVGCADSEPSVVADLEKAEEEGALEISSQLEDALGETCLACQRPIDQVHTVERGYRMKVTITFECEIDVRAISAVEAQSFVHETLSTIHLEDSRAALEIELEENVPMVRNTQVTDCFYELEAAKVIPPDQTIFLKRIK